jgi:hypothetical protein
VSLGLSKGDTDQVFLRGEVGDERQLDLAEHARLLLSKVAEREIALEAGIDSVARLESSSRRERYTSESSSPIATDS